MYVKLHLAINVVCGMFNFVVVASKYIKNINQI